MPLRSMHANRFLRAHRRPPPLRDRRVGIGSPPLPRSARRAQRSSTGRMGKRDETMDSMRVQTKPKRSNLRGALGLELGQEQIRLLLVAKHGDAAAGGRRRVKHALRRRRVADKEATKEGGGGGGDRLEELKEKKIEGKKWDT